MSAILPASSPGWGFKPNNTQWHSFLPYDTEVSALKRKLSMDEDVISPDDSPVEEPEESEKTHRKILKPVSSTRRESPVPKSPSRRAAFTKKARVNRSAPRALPVWRLVESLDRKGLQNLICNLCQENPSLTARVEDLSPTLTVACAVDNLSHYLDQVTLAIPYKDNRQGDYGYLRVKPVLDDFMSALFDYVAHFLPPTESQPSNTLAFLDGATSNVHKLPEWANENNNHAKRTAYDHLSHSWCIAINEAVQMMTPLSLTYGGWCHKLKRHNEISGNRLEHVLQLLQKHELI